jgi:elongation factor Ts
VVGSYIHSDRIGVIVEVNCETDFVARTQDFKTFARDIAMHIAAMSPDYADPESVPQEVVKKEREIYAAEVGDKPADIREKIIEGKLEKFYDAVCLSRQAYVKDPEKSVGELTTELAAKVGENVRIGRFARIELGVE